MKRLNVNEMGERILADGISVSNDTIQTGLNNNDLIIGGSGSGKTGGYIFHALLNPQGSIVVSDTKGQLYGMFEKYLKSKGYDVKIVDFVRPERSMPYNPLDYIGRTSSGEFMEKDIKKLANIIVPELDKRDPFWEKAAKRYITMLIAYVLEALPREEHNFSSVVKFHQSFMTGQGRVLMTEWSKIHPNNFSSRKYFEMKESCTAERMWYSIMEFANEALDPFCYREYDTIFSHTNGIKVEDIAKKKTVLFVNSSDSDTSFHVFSHIFFSQALQVLMETADKSKNGKLRIPVRLILDDFAASPKIDNFDNTISVIRSRNISVSVIIQSISQLWSRYSRDMGATIINNCDHILFLAGHDQDTANYLAQYMNKSAHTILTLPRKNAVLITEGEDARIVNKLKPYSVDIQALMRESEKQTPSNESTMLGA